MRWRCTLLVSTQFLASRLHCLTNEHLPDTGNEEVTRGKRRKDLLQIVHPRTSSKNFKMLSDLSQDHMSLSISYHCAVVHPVSRLRIVNN